MQERVGKELRRHHHDQLFGWLADVQPGLVEVSDHLENLLADAWDEFQGGDEESIAGYKVRGRLERVEWKPPLLSFVIERHGRTCVGSTRADLSIQRLADEVAGRIVRGEPDERVYRSEDGSVHVVLGRVFPKGTGYQQTVLPRHENSSLISPIRPENCLAPLIRLSEKECRRKRLRQAVTERLEQNGWRAEGGGRFRPPLEKDKV